MTSAASPPTLDEQLCFDLYAASRAVVSLYRPLLGQLGITYPQYLVLLVLWSDGPCHVKHVAQTLHLDHGTLTPLLRRMQTSGLVTRTRSTTDERYLEVALTEAGTALGDRARGVHCQVKDVLGLTEETFGNLQASLRVVTARARESGPDRVG